MENSYETKAKRKIKDSVFTNLFKQRNYTLKLYQALHPEDKGVKKRDIKIVTLQNVVVNKPYNDLSFTVGKKLMVFVESQSTWSENIIIRVLLYLAQTIQRNIKSQKQNIYGSAKIEIPEPEFYVIYVGQDEKERPAELKLSTEFFGGRDVALEVKVKVLRDGKPGDIINQYVDFTKVYNEQKAISGETDKAVRDTIRICKERNILREYLESREEEVFDIMMTLFDQGFVVDAYVAERERVVAQEAAQDKTRQIVLNMKQKGASDAMIADFVNVSVDQVKQWTGAV